MQRTHCDLCNELVSGYKTWCELIDYERKNHIIHIRTLPSGSARIDPDFCVSCWRKILIKMAEDLKVEEAQ
jgi:hypothetical protein